MGLLDQIGVKRETTYGTAGVVDRFLEFTSEGIKRRNIVINDDSRRPSGRSSRRGPRRVVTGRDAAGPITFPVTPAGTGIWFEQALGKVATSQPDAVNAPTVYEHLAEVDFTWDKSLTVQVGREREDRTVVPFTYVGSKITQLQLAIDTNARLIATATIDARDELVDQALAVASYPASAPFHFMQAAITLDAAAVANVRSAQVDIANPMDTDRYFIGSAGLKAQPRDSDKVAVSGQLVVDFVSREALYDAFRGDTPLALDLTFTGGNISGAFNEELKVTVPDIRLNGDTPNVGGPALPQMTIPFEGFEDAASADVSILLRNTDAAA
jgi:hypothetical protein